MKKKTMQTWFVVLFVIGLVIGWLLPGDIMAFSKKISENPLKPEIFDVPKKFGQLDLESDYFKYTILANAEMGGIELIRLNDEVPMHMHPKENHFVYIYKGKAKGTVGDVTAEVSTGQLIAIPAGIPHKLERIGDSPVEIILFSTPPFVVGDTVFLERE